MSNVRICRKRTPPDRQCEVMFRLTLCRIAYQVALFVYSFHFVCKAMSSEFCRILVSLSVNSIPITFHTELSYLQLITLTIILSNSVCVRVWVGVRQEGIRYHREPSQTTKRSRHPHNACRRLWAWLRVRAGYTAVGTLWSPRSGCRVDQLSLTLWCRKTSVSVYFAHIYLRARSKTFFQLYAKKNKANKAGTGAD